MVVRAQFADGRALTAKALKCTGSVSAAWHQEVAVPDGDCQVAPPHQEAT